MKSKMSLLTILVSLAAVLQQGRAFSTAARRIPAPTTSTPEHANVVDEQAVSTQREVYQKAAGEIASSFEPHEFKPVPWLANCHLQTIGGVFLRHIPECSNVVDIGDTLQALVKQSISETSNNGKFWDRRERIETPDGDWFHVDYKDQIAQSGSAGLMVMTHGLEASSDSSLCIDMAKAYHALGLQVACINFRGCSGEPNDTLGFYHLGFTDDLKLFLGHASQMEQRPIFLSGFSLGGNVILKALGELQEEAVDKYNIQGASIFCTPLDLIRDHPRLTEPGINSAVYTKSLLGSLNGKAQIAMELRCGGDPNTDKFDYKGCMDAKYIKDFDDAFVAPVYGFDDALDYYRKCSSIHFLERICVPTLVLNGEDDPFLDGTHQPTYLTHEKGGKAPVKMIHSPKGGHCGFIFHQISADEPRPVASFGPHEMARFINHAMVNGKKE